METVKIEILNPKAKLLLKNLADLKLIRIKKMKTRSEFEEILQKLRVKADEVPSLEEITREVEQVREARNEK